MPQLLYIDRSFECNYSVIVVFSHTTDDTSTLVDSFGRVGITASDNVEMNSLFYLWDNFLK